MAPKARGETPKKASLGRSSQQGKILQVNSSVGEHGNRVQVAIRCRPLNAQEKQLSTKFVWRLKPKAVEELNDDGIQPTGKNYQYDNVFSFDVPNDEVYERTCKNIVQSALEGYNGTIFAYGQTSTGKTYTLMGEKQSPGVTQRAFEDVFKWIGSHPQAQWDVSASYMEIYNEQIQDLLQSDLHKGCNLKVVDDKTVGPTVQGITEVRVVNVQHLLDVLREGEKRRSYAATGMNANSSRSHALFRLQIKSYSMVAGNADETAEKMRTVANEFMSTRCSIGADYGSLYIVDREHDELYIQSGDITLRMPMGQGIAGAVATNGKVANIPDAYKDSRFNPEVDRRTGYLTKAILCVPIFCENEVVGVVQFINKKANQEGDLFFNDGDEACVARLAQRIGPLIVEAQAAARTSLVSRLNLVDLAGSERAQKTGATGTLLKESGHINTSLMTLGTCIGLLSEGKDQHIPFRNSKLTHLLSSSLGGNANTCMICTFSPAARNRNETVSTLQFASRAKKIVNEVKQNRLVDQAALLATYEAEIGRLKAQLKRASQAIPDTNGPMVARQASDDPADVEADVEIVLSEAFAARLQKIESETEEAEQLMNSALAHGAPRIGLSVFFAVHAAGTGYPEVVIRMMRGDVSENGAQYDNSNNLYRKDVEWISEAELLRQIEWLRKGQSYEAPLVAAGGRIINDAWTYTGSHDGPGSLVLEAIPDHANANAGAQDGSHLGDPATRFVQTYQDAPCGGGRDPDPPRQTSDPETQDVELRGLVTELNALLRRREEEQSPELRDKEHLQAELSSTRAMLSTVKAELARACDERDTLRTKLQQTQKELEQLVFNQTAKETKDQTQKEMEQKNHSTSTHPRDSPLRIWSPSQTRRRDLISTPVAFIGASSMPRADPVHVMPPTRTNLPASCQGTNVMLSAGRQSPIRSQTPEPIRMVTPPIMLSAGGISSRDQSPHAVRIRVSPKLSHTVPPAVVTATYPKPPMAAQTPATPITPFPIDVASVLVPPVPTAILPSMTLGSATPGLRSAVASPITNARSFELMGSARLVGATPIQVPDTPPQDGWRDTVFVSAGGAGSSIAAAAPAARPVAQVLSASLPFAKAPTATLRSRGSASTDRRYSDGTQGRTSPGHSMRNSSVDSKPRPRAASAGRRANLESDRGRSVRL